MRSLEQHLVHGRRTKHQESVERQQKVKVHGAIVTERLGGSDQVESQRVTVYLKTHNVNTALFEISNDLPCVLRKLSARL